MDQTLSIQSCIIYPITMDSVEAVSNIQTGEAVSPTISVASSFQTPKASISDFGYHGQYLAILKHHFRNHNRSA